MNFLSIPLQDRYTVSLTTQTAVGVATVLCRYPDHIGRAGFAAEEAAAVRRVEQQFRQRSGLAWWVAASVMVMPFDPSPTAN